MSSYLHSTMLWLAVLTSSGRVLAPHSQCNSCEKTDLIPHKDLPEVELEMDFVGGSVPETLAKIHHEHEQTMSTNTGPNAASTSGHSRSKSESSALPRNSDRQVDLASNTLRRARARGNRYTHSRRSSSSSYAPIIVVPGIVNSSFFLFPPEPKPRPTAKNTTPKRRLESFSEKSLEEERTVGRDNLLSEEKEEALASESAHSRSNSSSSTNSRSTSAFGSSRSRSSFDSFGSQSSGSYTSYSSDEHHDTEECSHRHRVSRVLEGD